ncbi:hypothetical protein RSOLAG22IIIB_06112 [Rhizoctonia solani]|uniref:Uncharacterized protein n=1 Tax=Rhizoctonia solani TaxID=456999 RepID=A0A0K6GBX9_9AGAM|nr:hypothetical protein RSOLAG22IIIB_06112 [Rhizoctonia solani]
MNDHSSTGKIESLFSGEFSSILDTDSSSVSVSEGTKVEDEPKKPVEKVESSEITLSIEPVIVKPVSLDEKMAARKRLIPNAVGSTKHEREEASSNLKEFIYRHPCLPSDLDGSPCNGFLTAEERAEIEEAVHAGTVFLDESGSHANAKAMLAKRDAIEVVETPIQAPLQGSRNWTSSAQGPATSYICCQNLYLSGPR